VTTRSSLSAALAIGGLGLGLWTAWVASANHRLARELDRRHRACDALQVWNERLRDEVMTSEEALLTELREGAQLIVAEGEL
jgi:hypothetical protein